MASADGEPSQGPYVSLEPWAPDEVDPDILGSDPYASVQKQVQAAPPVSPTSLAPPQRKSKARTKPALNVLNDGFPPYSIIDGKQDRLLTRTQAMKVRSCSDTHIDHLNKAGIIKKYTHNGEVRYKESELLGPFQAEVEEE